MAIRVPQPRLSEPPELFGANRLARLKIQALSLVTTPEATVIADSAITAHETAADPHSQYVANDPALR